jgi:branched-chain amino acid transport system permease protein
VTTLFIYCILALGLNVMVGYTGLVHLGIAAFFGIGAYLMAILTVPMYPFQIGFLAATIVSVLATAGIGLALGAPTLRLRGDYLAIVTLGFGEVVKVTLRNLEQITGGMKGLNPVPPPGAGVKVGGIDLGLAFAIDPRWFYYLSLLALAGVVVAMRRLEQSRLGRAWVAVREDELAASAMGISATRVKLSAFAMSSAVAGLAGCLYAASLSTTADPNAYDFNRSIMVLCAVILGGLGSIPGTILGVAILVGFDTVLAPWAPSLVLAASTSGLCVNAAISSLENTCGTVDILEGVERNLIPWLPRGVWIWTWTWPWPSAPCPIRRPCTFPCRPPTPQ